MVRSCIMIPSVIDYPLPLPCLGGNEITILVVTRDAASRSVISNRLLDAGLRVTTAATFGVVELLLGASEAFDLMIIAQSSEETTLFGVPQLTRSIDADLPILVVDFETVDSAVLVELVEDAVLRWPHRERACRALH